MAAGVVVGSDLSDKSFGIMLGCIILALLGLMIWQDAGNRKKSIRAPGGFLSWPG